MDNLYILDGSGYIFRAYFATPPLTNKNGFPTNAIYAFSRMVLKFLQEAHPAYFVVAFDTGKPSYRQGIYKDYKANRLAAPEALIKQMPFFREVVKLLGIRAIEVENYEADDVIATLVDRYRADFERITIISGDKDLTQLVSANVEVWDAMRDIHFTEERVTDKFGVPPRLILDYLALAGDSSDNIPGAKGIGQKTASQLLAHGHGVRELLANPDLIDSFEAMRGKDKLKAKLQESREAIELSLELVSLARNVPMPAEIDGIEALRLGSPYREKLDDLFSEFSFESLLADKDGTTTPERASSRYEGKSYQLVTPDKLAAFAEKLESVECFALDTETTSLQTVSTQLVGISISWQANEAYYIPVTLKPAHGVPPAADTLSADTLSALDIRSSSDIDSKTDSNIDSKTDSNTDSKISSNTGSANDSVVGHAVQTTLFATTASPRAFDVRLGSMPAVDGDAQGEFVTATKASESSSLEDILRYLQPAFGDERITKVGFNLKFDMEVLEEHGFQIRGKLFDSLIASYLLEPDQGRRGLKFLARDILNEEMVNFSDLVSKDGTIADLPICDVVNYACHDADASWSLYRHFIKFFPRGEADSCPSLSYVYYNVEMLLIPVLAAMERAGVYVDAAYLTELSDEFQKELLRIEGAIYVDAGLRFNLNSPKQVSEVLFETLMLPTTGLKKTVHGYSTDAEVLSQLAGISPVARQMLEYRELFKLKTTYLDGLSRLICPKTGRLHTSFNQAVVATGRLSSSEPNLQNIPARGERGKRLRRAFVASPGKALIIADYSQIELRVLAHLSGDENLTAAFHSGEDIHLKTARELFGQRKVQSAQQSMFPTATQRDGGARVDGETDNGAGRPEDITPQHITSEQTTSEQITSEQRSVAKTINFGVIYGISAFRLAGQLGVSRSEAQKFIDNYFARYPRVREYFDGLERQIGENGYLETVLGRRRFASKIDSTRRDKGYVLRSMQNFPIQGSAAEIIKLAMLRVHAALTDLPGKPSLILQVHDELILEVTESAAEEVKSVVVSLMEAAYPLNVPLVVDAEVNHFWT